MTDARVRAVPAATGYLCVVVGAAGSVDDARIDAVRRTLGRGVEVARVGDEISLEDALDRRDERTPVVVGGDGTVHVLVAALDRRGELDAVAVGLVPSGTGNDLARTIGLPVDPVEACRVVLEGRPRALDLVRVDEEIVVNASHAGVGVGAAARADGLKGLLGPAAYAAGGLVAGADAQAAVDLRVRVDGEEVTEEGRPLLLAGVGNGRTIGGGTALFPSAEPDDGLLEVLTVVDRPLGQRPAVGLAVRRGTHASLEGVDLRRGREVVVRGRAAWDDDGELGAPRDGRHFRAVPRAWRVLARHGGLR